jgi:ubiquitin thioesterase protein OTUB1
MKANRENYEPFMIGNSVDSYCRESIDPYQVEIEHLGMNALIDALILPAGMSVEVIYLDRSAGDEVNEHVFQQLGNDNLPTTPNAPTFRLLYRPGHYDILYKIEDVAPVISQPQATDLTPHVAVAHRFSPSHGFQDLNIPRGNIANSPWLEMSYLMSPSVQSQPLSPPPVSPSTSAISPVAASPLSPVTPSGIGGDTFRRSKYEYEYQTAESDRPFQTATFRK